jgi:SAM-dependent methyltransferase
LNAFFKRCFPNKPPCGSLDFQLLVAEHLPQPGKLLDVGCGDNALLERHRTPEVEVWGTDFAAHPQLKHTDWFRPLYRNGSLPFADQTFDVVTSFMVMEHVDDPTRFLAEITRVLKPGGAYVGQSIHAWHYITWIRRAFDVVPHSWVQRLVKRLYGREEHDTFPTCYRLNSRRTLQRFACEAKLEWCDWRTFANQGYFVMTPATYHAATLLDWGLEQVHPGLGSIYFNVVLTKPRSAVLAKLAA